MKASENRRSTKIATSKNHQIVETEALKNCQDSEFQSFRLKCVELKWLEKKGESLTKITWGWLKRNEKALTAIGTFVSALGSIAIATQAYSIANQARVTAVLSFQEKRIQEAALVESFVKVNEIILNAKKEMRSIGITDRKTYGEYGDYINRTIESDDQEIKEDIQLVFSFYRGVANCVNQGACDKGAALKIFDEDVQDFNVIFAPYFCKLAEDTGDYTITEGLETFYGAKKGVFNDKSCSSLTAFNSVNQV